jgi:hypothetical protein
MLGAEFARESYKSVAPSRCEHEIGSTGSQLTRQRRADSRTCSGD